MSLLLPATFEFQFFHPIIFEGRGDIFTFSVTILALDLGDSVMIDTRVL